jgi:hypothetical protein
MANIKEPAHGTCDTFCKFLDGNCVVRRRLVLDHDLAGPIHVTWPLKIGALALRFVSMG